MKRFALFLLCMLFFTPVQAASFPDTGSSQFETEIARLKESGAVSGYPEDGTFRPNKWINRAEFVKILLEYNQELQGTGPGMCFTDFNPGGVETAEWYYAYACEAKALGYIQGYPDGSFGGEENINLAEALKIVISAKRLPLPQYEEQPEQWYDPYVSVAREYSIFNRIPADPAHLVTRGEMAFIVVTVGNAAMTPTSSSKAAMPEGNWSSSFLFQETFYDCSREIEGEWKEVSMGPMGTRYYFYPLNQEEFTKFCRPGAVIEYKAVLDILQREDVSRSIETYDTAHAWVRALGHTYINDKDYLRRILPAYSDVKIDCIIVVHTPENTRFFIENGDVHKSHDDHHYLEVPAKEFLQSLNGAPDVDVTNFWLGLH